jgi:hypothetical protein
VDNREFILGDDKAKGVAVSYGQEPKRVLGINSTSGEMNRIWAQLLAIPVRLWNRLWLGIASG